MKLKKMYFWGYECLRCGHHWLPRLKQEPNGAMPEIASKDEPRMCPKCKSVRWDRGEEKRDTGARNEK